MIVVDTSVWIDFFRRRMAAPDDFDDRLTKRQLSAPSFVFGELLQGARDAVERSVLRGVWDALPRMNEDDIWLEAGDFASSKKTHPMGVGLIDVAILLVARRHRARVWTYDKKLLQLLGSADRFVA